MDNGQADLVISCSDLPCCNPVISISNVPYSPGIRFRVNGISSMVYKCIQTILHPRSHSYSSSGLVARAGWPAIRLEPFSFPAQSYFPYKVSFSLYSARSCNKDKRTYIIDVCYSCDKCWEQCSPHDNIPCCSLCEFKMLVYVFSLSISFTSFTGAQSSPCHSKGEIHIPSDSIFR